MSTACALPTGQSYLSKVINALYWKKPTSRHRITKAAYFGKHINNNFVIISQGLESQGEAKPEAEAQILVLPLSVNEQKLGAFIKESRKEKGMLLTVFADLLNCSVVEAVTIEDGGVFLTGEKLLDVTRILEIPFDILYHYIKNCPDLRSLKRKDTVMRKISNWGILAMVREELMERSKNTPLDIKDE